jgi:hypothetical protein
MGQVAAAAAAAAAAVADGKVTVYRHPLPSFLKWVMLKT